MIKKIMKRDSVTIEPFTPAKLINWGEWASRSLPGRGDWWHEVIKDVLESFKDQEIVHSQKLQKTLITTLLQIGSWPANKMAGRLYAASLRKELYGELMPTVRALHSKLIKVGLMTPQPYSVAEYAEVESIINHDRDFDLAHSQIHQNRKKYALRPQNTKAEYETPQFIFMRMAMAAASFEDVSIRMRRVSSLYDQFSLAKINPPSPNYINFGTSHHGYASCVLIKADDTIDSLAIHDHIAYVMTGMSAGIGTTIHTRGPGEPVRGGAIIHQGKHGYYQSLGKATKANIQAGRGGACNTFFSVYDPEAMLLTNAQSVMASDDKKNRDIKFTVMFNQFFAEKVANCEEVFQFTPKTQPELWTLFNSGNREGFAKLYNQIDADGSVKKTYFDAREYLLYAGLKSNEVSTLHYAFIDEMNIHTPFDEPIYSSNLCVEITEPTAAYHDMRHLYSEEDNGYIRLLNEVGQEFKTAHSERVVVMRNNERKITYAGGLREGDVIYESPKLEQSSGLLKVKKIIEAVPTSEVALCSLAAIPVCNINSDEEYASAAYDSLKMIDYCIHRSTYKLPHIGWTAKNRMNAAVGMMGVSTVLARKGLKYGSIEGRREIHRMAERHAYFVISASLRIAKERGNAPWIHKTKWAQGWLPVDTYNRNVDLLVDEPLHYDWEALRSSIIEQGGIGHCAVIANMPTESSSKSSGVPRSVMPVEEVSSKRADTSNVVDWVAVDSDIYEYESAYDVKTTDLIADYAIIQKFTDQTTSADIFKDRNKTKLTESEMINEFLMMAKYGMKTRYYQQTKSYGVDKTEVVTHSAILDAKAKLTTTVKEELDEFSKAPTIDDLTIDFEDVLDANGPCSSGACST